MGKLPIASFAALVGASIVAFFVTQHLKVTTPLVAGSPAPYPASINPLDGITCGGLDHRRTLMSFYLLYRADDVDVYIVDQNGNEVRTIASYRHMRRKVRTPDGVFYWNGRADDGTIVPDGNYYFRIALIHQGRTIQVPKAIHVITVPPHPMVTSVSPSLMPQGHKRVTIHFTGNEQRYGTIRIYRTDLPGKPRLVTSFLTPGTGQTALWNGKINHRPAPAGTYLMGLDVTDAACNTGHFPSTLPPPPSSTPHAGVTVRYLAAEPPLTPVQAGSQAIVYVDSRHQPYAWALTRVGQSKQAAAGRSEQVALRIPVPTGGAGLYELAVNTRTHTTTVPLVASRAREAPLLVVLPALTWQGLNPVDDDGDGLPNTLTAGGPIKLERPFANGLPPEFGDEAGLLQYLDRTHHAYQLTTDIALAEGVGPPLSGHSVVLLDGSVRWIPSTLAGALRSYVQGGGHVLAVGTDSMLSSVTVGAGMAQDPTAPDGTDALGAQRGTTITGNHGLITVVDDGLGIFQGTAGAFGGFTSFEPITGVASPAEIVSQAGVSPDSSSIVGYDLGRGIVVDITLAGFGSGLRGNVDSQQVVDRILAVLSK